MGHLLRWLLIAVVVVTSPAWLPGVVALFIWTYRQHVSRERTGEWRSGFWWQ